MNEPMFAGVFFICLGSILFVIGSIGRGIDGWLVSRINQAQKNTLDPIECIQVNAKGVSISKIGNTLYVNPKEKEATT